MDAVIKISSAEFNEELFKKINQLLKGRKASITIAVHEEGNSSVLNEPIEEYWSRLQKSVDNIEAGNGTIYSMEELEVFIKN